MLRVLIEMSALIGVGTLWRAVSPTWLDAKRLRLWLTQSVFYLFLPALVLKVLWQAPINADSLRISLTAISTIFVALAATRFIYRFITINRPALGAALLAAVFPNVTYMGLPVLSALYGEPAQAIAIQYDLFGTSPLLFTLGIAVALHYSQCSESRSGLFELLRIPALWAAAFAVGLQTLSVSPPEPVMQGLQWLSIPVVPFMLFAIGLSLNWRYFETDRLRLIIPVIAVQFVLAPIYAWGFAATIGLQGNSLDAVVLEAAMPCMVLGIVLCDRYCLDSPLFATAVTLTTVASIAVIPLWFTILQI